MQWGEDAHGVVWMGIQANLRCLQINFRNESSPMGSENHQKGRLRVSVRRGTRTRGKSCVELVGDEYELLAQNFLASIVARFEAPRFQCVDTYWGKGL